MQPAGSRPDIQKSKEASNRLEAELKQSLKGNADLEAEAELLRRSYTAVSYTLNN